MKVVTEQASEEGIRTWEAERETEL